MKKSIYGKMMAISLVLIQVIVFCGCAKENAAGDSSNSSSLFEPMSGTVTDESQDSNQQNTSEADTPSGNVGEDISAVEAQTENVEKETDKELNVTEEQAILAIQNYCYINNPDLENIVKEGEYQVYWDVSTDDEGEIVVLFRSYTGAIIRYYIDPLTGNTYVTEFVPGITEDEERTDESFNVKNYMN